MKRISSFVVALLLAATGLLTTASGQGVKGTHVKDADDKDTHAKDVNVVNSPNVNVVNTPNVNVVNTPTVTLGNTPSVNVANSPSVKVSMTPPNPCSPAGSTTQGAYPTMRDRAATTHREAVPLTCSLQSTAYLA